MVMYAFSVVQSCPTLLDPWTAAHQAPLSMAFSRQEILEWLPLPPPGIFLRFRDWTQDCHIPCCQETPWCWCGACMLSHFSHIRLCNPMDCSPLGSSISKPEYWNGLPCPPPGDLPNPGTEPTSLMSLPLQAGSLSLVPPGKPPWRS